MDAETKQLIISTAKNVEILISDVSELKSDVSELKSDVSELKSDVSELKSDVGIMKTEIDTLQSDGKIVKDTVHHMSHQIDFLQFDLSAFRKETDVNFTLVRGEFTRLENHLDGFACSSKRFDVEDAAMRHRQDRLEKKLNRYAPKSHKVKTTSK